MITDAVFSVLSNAPPVSAIVGVPPNIFSGEAPASQKNPYIVIRQFGGDTEMTMDGPSGRQYIRLQISCYGGYLQSKKLARAVRQALERFTGICQDGTQIDNVQTVLETDTFESAPYQYLTQVELETTYLDPTF